MADDKGSDLDVFEGLAKKAPRGPTPGLMPPPPSNARKSTLVGGVGVPLPPPPGTAATPLPPPAMPGLPGALPPPGRLSTPMPPPPPGAAGAPASLPMPPAPPPPASMPLPPPPPGAVGAPASLPMPPAASVPLPPPLGAASMPVPLPPPAAPLPPPVAAPADAAKGAPAPGGKAVDMDWDDEEESTHVFDQKSSDGSAGPRPAAGMPPASAAATLMASSGSAARPLPSGAVPMAAPPVMATLPSASPVPLPQPPSRRSEEATAIRPRPVSAQLAPAAGGSKAGIVLSALALLAVIGLAVFMFLPKKGALSIDIQAKSGGPIAKAEIFVDGQKKCDTTPCKVQGLEPGPKVVKVDVPDARGEMVIANVEAGKEVPVMVTVEISSTSAPVASSAPMNVTGLKILAATPNAKVFVDGTDKGTLPAELKELAPGAHKLRFEAGERYEKLEQSVDVEAGKLKEIGPIKLKVLKGQIAVELATEGATVKLVDEKKVEKKVPESELKKGPVKIELDPSKRWKVVATKKGMDDFSQEISFDDGMAEKSVRIDLAEAAKSSAAGSAAGPTTGTASTPATEQNAGSGSKDPPAAATGTATLNINSIPVSKVVLDGRPLGSTPKVGVSVPPGSHTVTFIHPELGRKQVTVNVKAGETKTAAIRFK